MGRRDNGDGHIWEDLERKCWRGSISTASRRQYVHGDTKRIVAAKLKAIKLERDSGYTVRKAAGEWVKEHVSTCRFETRSQYDQMLRLHILPIIGDKRIEDVRPRDIQQVINTMTQGPATKHHAHKVAYAMFRWMVRNRMIEHSPVDGIRLPVIGPGTRKSLSSDEIVRLLEAMKDSRWKYSVQLILMTGLRRGELLALKWEDIGTSINICRTRSSDGSEGPPKSNAGNRSILIGKAVQGVLDAQAEMLVIEGIKSPYVFPTEKGKPMTPSTYHHTLDWFAKKAGIKVSVHELRHTFVSLSAKGMDLKALQAILGHSKATVTLDIYRHMIEGDERHAADLVDEAAFRLGIVQSAPQSAPETKKRAPG